MSCFGHRPRREPLSSSSSRVNRLDATSTLNRRSESGKSTSTKMSAVTQEPISNPIDLKQLSVPIEDLGATKRRLVCIRRQNDYAPVSLQVGFKSRTGWQALTTTKENQDSLALIMPLPEPLQEYSLFGVFDGHGKMGHKVSAYVAENISNHFKAILAADKTIAVGRALRRACLRTNKSLLRHPKMDVSLTGTTAAVAVVHGRRLMCANVGDSRIVIGTVRNGVVVPLVLTTDHAPDIPAERKRIEEAGGRVESWSPDGLDTGPPRVWLKDKRMPGLAMSRVLGDKMLEGIVSAEPEMSVHQLAEEDLFVVLATDGIWGEMSNEEVVSFIASRGKQSCQQIAEDLVKHAAGLWYASGTDGIDDISVILIRLNW